MKVDIKTARALSSNGKEKRYVVINDVFYIQIKRTLWDELNRFLAEEQSKPICKTTDMPYSSCRPCRSSHKD